MSDSNQLAPVPRAPLPLTVTPATELRDCPTNLDLTTPKHRSWAVAAGNPADYDIGTDGTLRIAATHWLVMPEQRVDEDTGEVKDIAALILFDRDGKFARLTSAFAAPRMRAILSLYSPDEWESGIPFVVRVRRSKRGRNYHDIRVEIP